MRPCRRTSGGYGKAGAVHEAAPEDEGAAAEGLGESVSTTPGRGGGAGTRGSRASASALVTPSDSGDRERSGASDPAFPGLAPTGSDSRAVRGGKVGAMPPRRHVAHAPTATQAAPKGKDTKSVSRFVTAPPSALPIEPPRVADTVPDRIDNVKVVIRTPIRCRPRDPRTPRNHSPIPSAARAEAAKSSATGPTSWTSAIAAPVAPP